MRSHKEEFMAKKKALTIHIDTDLVGPHGMPLVYGSTPEKIGSLKGSVRFSSNYDCKGRDIQIIYEAWTESHWTSVVNKKLVHHHTKDVFGYQTWTLPLIHTKNNGSTVVSGVYKKDFEVLLIHPCDRVRHSFDSARSSCSSSSSSAASSLESQTTTTTTTSSAASVASSSASTLLPSSSYSPQSKIKYTIRAVLRRPFPSLSNVEASQEVWVVNDVPPCESTEPLNLYEASSECLESSHSIASSSCASSVHSQESVSSFEDNVTYQFSSTASASHPVAAAPRKQHSSWMTYAGEQTLLLIPIFVSLLLLLEHLFGGMAVWGFLLLALYTYPRTRVLQAVLSPTEP
ncbi:hypothetical protein EC968_009464 [Mortierella alpina]|nr:hypothetical protein EC968_009464 [Mortierella alpina]